MYIVIVDIIKKTSIHCMHMSNCVIFLPSIAGLYNMADFHFVFDLLTVWHKEALKNNHLVEKYNVILNTLIVNCCK